MDERRPATRVEFERIAEKAAKQALKHSFEMLFGIDVNNLDEVNDLREDLLRMRRMRKMGDRIGVAALIATTTLAVSGAASFVWNAIKNAVRGLQVP